MIPVRSVHAARTQQRILEAFRAAHALEPRSAATLARLGIADDAIFRQLLGRDIVREVRAGEFYFDVDAYREYRNTQWRWAAVPIALVLALLAWLLAGGGR